MKILIIFGSKSDAYIYDPLKSRLLSQGHSVDFRFLSVHRSPELLDRELESLDAQVVIAGAGLAAHLPGVLASKLLLPVIGLPCTPAFAGMDSMLSMLQMPFGIPVLVSSPDQVATVVDFVETLSSVELQFSEVPVQIVVPKTAVQLPHMESLLERAKAIAAKVNLALPVRNTLSSNSVNVVLAEIDSRDPEAPLGIESQSRGEGSVCIHVPVFRENAYRDANSAFHLLQKMRAVGGLWVGANNVGNGFLAGLEIANVDGSYSAALTNAKKGYIHLYG